MKKKTTFKNQKAIFFFIKKYKLRSQKQTRDTEAVVNGKRQRVFDEKEPQNLLDAAFIYF